MSSLCALSIVTAVLCGIWSYLAGIAGLIGWEKDHDYESDRRPMWNDDHHT